MNRRDLLKGIGATGLFVAGAGAASGATGQALDGDGGSSELYVRFPDSDRDDVTIQSDCVIECCNDPCPCSACLCERFC